MIYHLVYIYFYYSRISANIYYIIWYNNCYYTHNAYTIVV